MSDAAPHHPEGFSGDEPEWFRLALAAPVTDATVAVNGCAIAYRCWGNPGKPGVVLVHGGAAHSRWWDHVAPFFSDDCCVIALDLSGHGDSGRRRRYSTGDWADEILAVADRVTGAEPPVVAAHSMGGFAAIRAAARSGDRLKGVIIVDSPVRTLSPEEEASRDGQFATVRTYPSRSAALARFRPVPDQPNPLPFVVDHIARTSVRPSGDGWSWKFDPACFAVRDSPDPDLLSLVTCRVALLRAQFGLVTPDIGAFMYEKLGRNAPVIEIPDAYHHIMLDQPLSLVTAIRTLLGDWRHSSAVPPEWT